MKFILLASFLHVLVQLRPLASVVLTRHGARAPLNFYEKVEDVFGETGEGGLTEIGRRQLQMLGRQLRKEYGTEIEIEAFSGVLSRVTYSGLHFLSGLTQKNIHFGGEEGQLLNTLYDNSKLFKGKQCFHQEHAFKDRKLTTEEIKIINSDPVLLELMPKMTIKVLKKVYDLVICTNFQEKDYFPLSKSSLRLLRRSFIEKYYLNKPTEDENRAATTHMFSKIVSFLKNSFTKKTFQVLYFSGRDYDFINLHNTLLDQQYLSSLINKAELDDSAFSFLAPTFASSLIFELHEANSQFKIKIRYNNEENYTHLSNGYFPDGMELDAFLAFLESKTDKSLIKQDCFNYQ